MRNSAGEKSPTVRLQMSRPSAARARTSAAILRISDPMIDAASADGRGAALISRTGEGIGGRYLGLAGRALLLPLPLPLKYTGSTGTTPYKDWHTTSQNLGEVSPRRPPLYTALAGHRRCQRRWATPS